MKINYKKHNSLILNGKAIKGDDLRRYCMSKIMQNPEEWEKDVYAFMMSWLNPNPCVTVKTSGSTGKPRNIQLAKIQMIKSAKRTGKFFNFSKNQRCLLAIPANRIGGIMMIVRAFVFKMELCLVKPSAEPIHPELLPLDFAPFTPMQAHNLLLNKEGKEFLHEIKNVILGGSGISKELLKLTSELTNKIYSTYGMTETTSHVALKRISHPTEDKYTTLNNIYIKTDNRDCLVVKGRGEIAIKTNDIVKIHDENSFEILGRIDNIINSGGVKLIPEQIEMAISGIINKNVILFPKEDPILGQKACALIEGDPLSQENLEDLNRKLLLVLKKVEIPKEWYFTPKFQYSQTDKINRSSSIESI